MALIYWLSAAKYEEISFTSAAAGVVPGVLSWRGKYIPTPGASLTEPVGASWAGITVSHQWNFLCIHGNDSRGRKPYVSVFSVCLSVHRPVLVNAISSELIDRNSSNIKKKFTAWKLYWFQLKQDQPTLWCKYIYCIYTVASAHVGPDMCTNITICLCY